MHSFGILKTTNDEFLVERGYCKLSETFNLFIMLTPLLFKQKLTGRFKPEVGITCQNKVGGESGDCEVS